MITVNPLCIGLSVISRIIGEGLLGGVSSFARLNQISNVKVKFVEYKIREQWRDDPTLWDTINGGNYFSFLSVSLNVASFGKFPVEIN